jgi:hypothetical protein
MQQLDREELCGKAHDLEDCADGHGAAERLVGTNGRCRKRRPTNSVNEVFCALVNGQAEVSKLHETISIDKEVLRFNVPAASSSGSIRLEDKSGTPNCAWIS